MLHFSSDYFLNRAEITNVIYVTFFLTTNTVLKHRRRNPMKITHYQFTNQSVDPQVMADISRGGVVTVSITSISKEWEKIINDSIFIAITPGENLERTRLHLYNGIVHRSNEIFKFLNKDGTTVEIFGSSSIQLPMGNIATFAMLSREVIDEIGIQAIEIINSITPSLSSKSTYDDREWRPQLIVCGKTVKLDLPDDSDYTKIRADETGGFMVYYGRDSYRIGLIERERINWCKKNTMVTEVEVQLAFDSFTVKQ